MTFAQEPRKVGAARNMAVFIDADNLSDATALDHVLTDLRHRAERVLYKRAYGRVESLKGIESVLWRHGVRPVSNMIVNKVTTDSAMVIDAVEAVCTQDIDAVAICSGDADFVPLATWIRERGCHVLCFSLSHKIFANPESFYDEVILLEVVEKPESPCASKPPEQELPIAIDSQRALPACADAPSGDIRAAPPVSSKLSPAAQPETEEMVAQVLAAVPVLRNGQGHHLSQVVATLRQKGILGKTTKTSLWFAKLGGAFHLQPALKPNQIIYIAGGPVLQSARSPEQPAASSPAVRRSELVRRVLAAVPDLRRSPQMLSHIVPVLRQKAILGKTTKSTVFFEQFPSHFKLSPKAQPTQVTYVGPLGASLVTGIPGRRIDANGER